MSHHASPSHRETFCSQTEIDIKTFVSELSDSSVSQNVPQCPEVQNHTTLVPPISPPCQHSPIRPITHEEALDAPVLQPASITPAHNFLPADDMLYHRPSMTRDDSNTPAGDSDADATRRFSRQQLVRLDAEWRRIQRAFAYHPYVRIDPTDGDPPCCFRIDYRIRTVILDEAGQLEYADSCAVELMLPAGFPHEMPIARPLAAVFHPNFAADLVNIDRYWTSTMSSLLDVVIGVGLMLAYQDFDSADVWNEAAMAWASANPRVLPVDPDASLLPEAGGEPLSRIARFGPRTLEHLRTQIKQFGDHLISAESPAAPDDVARQLTSIQQGLALFQADDIPPELRSAAQEIQAWVSQFPASLPTWESIRRQRDLAASAASLTRQMKDLRQSIGNEIEAVDALAAGAPSGDSAGAMRQIPSADMLQLHVERLAMILAGGRRLLDKAGPLLGTIGGLAPVTPPRSSGVMQARLEAECARAWDRVTQATPMMREAIDKSRVRLRRIRVYTHGLQRLVEWREYADLVDHSIDLVDRMMRWGCAGIQAVTIQIGPNRFGPYELEQPLSLAGRVVFFNNPASSILQMADLETGQVIAHSDTAHISLPVGETAAQQPDYPILLPPEGQDQPPATAAGATHVVVHFNGNCEELALQMDYLVREGARLASRLVTEVRRPKAWFGGLTDDLWSAHARRQLQREHAERSATWEGARYDLERIGPLKQRLATFRLLQRSTALAQRLATEEHAAQRNEREATGRIAQIVAASNTDLDTGRLLIPQKFAQDYAQQLRRRDQAMAALARVNARRASLAAEIQARVENGQLLGQAVEPDLHTLGLVPPAWNAMLDQVGDESIIACLADLEQALNQRLIPESWRQGPRPG